MAKFNIALSNHILDSKIKRYLTQPGYRTPDDTASKFKITNGVATYVTTPIAMVDNGSVIIYDLPEGAPKYAAIIRYRLITACDDLKLETMRVKL